MGVPRAEASEEHDPTIVHCGEDPVHCSLLHTQGCKAHDGMQGSGRGRSRLQGGYPVVTTTRSWLILRPRG